MFHFVMRSFQIHLKFWALKAVFCRNSVIIDFLKNKSIFSEKNYAVICFTLRSTQRKNMSGFDFLAVATKCSSVGNIRQLKFHDERNADDVY